MREKAPFPLMSGERLLLLTRPHPLAMLGLTAFWLALGGLGFVFLVYYPAVEAELNARLHLTFLAERGYDVIWFLAILVPLVVMAIFRINFGYIITLIFLLVGKIAIRWKLAPWLGDLAPPHLENFMLMGVGLLGMFGCEVFRRGHRYYLTTRRIVARFGSFRVSERSTLYSKIDDLILQQSIVGKLCGFGTVIPITSTGLGMGQDLAIAGAGVGAGKAGLNAGLFAAGAKGKNVPRELSIYVLYRIKHPAQARDLILEEMSARERPRRKAIPDEDTE